MKEIGDLTFMYGNEQRTHESWTHLFIYFISKINRTLSVSDRIWCLTPRSNLWEVILSVSLMQWRIRRAAGLL